MKHDVLIWHKGRGTILMHQEITQEDIEQLAVDKYLENHDEDGEIYGDLDKTII